MKSRPYLIGLACIVVGAGCLLAVYAHEKRVSDTSHITQKPIIVTASSTVVSATTTIASSSDATISLYTASTSEQAAPTEAAPVQKMTFEIVSTPALQQQGLGGRAVIPDNYAMLFVFPTDVTQGFWMKDMLTSIDMIWLSDNGTIVAIDGSVSPDTYPSVFYPPVPVKYVLETRAGFAVEKNWHVGTHVTLPLPY
jgi:uncharacterized membrane protein (UPF0127 family)